MITVETFAIASGGTTSNAIHVPGFTLVGLIVPALDSTQIKFEVEGPADTWARVKTNSGAAADRTVGDADTGSKAVAVPEEIGRLAAAARMRLIVATQSGGARSIIGLFAKV